MRPDPTWNRYDTWTTILIVATLLALLALRGCLA